MTRAGTHCRDQTLQGLRSLIACRQPAAHCKPGAPILWHGAPNACLEHGIQLQGNDSRNKPDKNAPLHPFFCCQRGRWAGGSRPSGRWILIYTYTGKLLWKCIVFLIDRQHLLTRQSLNYKHFHFEFDWKLKLGQCQRNIQEVTMTEAKLLQSTL